MRSVFLATAVLSVCPCNTQNLECNDDDESAFLQGRLVQVHPLRTEHEEDELPASLLKSVQNLARQTTHQTPEEVAEGIASVNAALEQMMTRLEDGHARAQHHIQSQLEEIQACHSSTSHGVTVRDDFQDRLAVMHTCIEDQAAASQTQQQRCDAWNSHADRLSFPSTNLPASAPPSERYLVATQLRDWVADEWPAVESQNAECSEATAHATAETERCTPVIANYAAVFCQHKISCNLLTACHHHEVDVYHSLISESEIGMASRQDQYRTVRQTECLMQLITEALSANTTVEESALNACDGDVDVQHLVLSFPDPEVLHDCPPAQPGDPHCEEPPLPVAWAGGEAEIIQETVEWTLIMQYGMAPIQNTAEAIGVVSESETGAAKLSDVDINALPSGGDPVYDYYLLQSDAFQEYGASGVRESIIIRTRRRFNNVLGDFGLSPIESCEGSYPSGTSVAECTEWSNAGTNVPEVNLNQQADDCSGWHTFGHSSHSMMCEAYLSDPQLPGATYKGPEPGRWNLHERHCFDFGHSGVCYHGRHPAMRENVKMYKFTGQATESSRPPTPAGEVIPCGGVWNGRYASDTDHNDFSPCVFADQSPGTATDENGCYISTGPWGPFCFYGDAEDWSNYGWCNCIPPP